MLVRRTADKQCTGNRLDRDADQRIVDRMRDEVDQQPNRLDARKQKQRHGPILERAGRGPAGERRRHEGRCAEADTQRTDLWTIEQDEEQETAAEDEDGALPQQRRRRSILQPDDQHQAALQRRNGATDHQNLNEIENHARRNHRQESLDQSPFDFMKED